MALKTDAALIASGSVNEESAAAGVLIRLSLPYRPSPLDQFPSLSAFGWFPRIGHVELPHHGSDQ